ncbi:hypothetical protein L2Z00_10905 [Tenacibaculum sp. MSW2]|nr:hypothetical protein [Tenacibaculum aquimarinum]MCH3885344.1 hypothetical protein [Tenacibaculum aquimarinum]
MLKPPPSTYSEKKSSETLLVPSVVVPFTGVLKADWLLAASFAKTVTAYVVEIVNPVTTNSVFVVFPFNVPSIKTS